MKNNMISFLVLPIVLNTTFLLRIKLIVVEITLATIVDNSITNKLLDELDKIVNITKSIIAVKADEIDALINFVNSFFFILY